MSVRPNAAIHRLMVARKRSWNTLTVEDHHLNGSSPAAENRAVGGVNGAVIFAMLALLSFLPSAARFLLDASSLMAGLMAACVLIWGMGVIGLYRIEGGRYWTNTLLVAAAVSFVVLAHGLLASLWFPLDWARSAGSLVGMVVMLVSAYQARTILWQATPVALHRGLKSMSIAFIAIALLSMLKVQPASVSIFDKPAFPFTEPSHFALTFAPFLIYQCVVTRLPVKLVWLAGTLGVALVLQNLSLVLAVGVAAVCCLPGLWLTAGLLAVIGAVGSLDLTYFTDRLDFSAQTTNLSALVYIQGTELMDAALKATSGWGIGFQQLGIAPINVPTSDLIYRLSQDDANLRDGGFQAAKLIAEMGGIGLVVVLCYAWVAARAVMMLRRNDADSRAEPLRVFVLSLIVSFSVEMFVRGLGYFSGTAMLQVTALLLVMEGGFLRRTSPKDHPCPV